MTNRIINAAAPPAVVEVDETNIVAGTISRISWGAVIAGAIFALTVQFAFNMLGLSIGATTINPLTEVNPFDSGLGTGAVIWFAASGLIAFFIGGFVAGRMAGMTDALDGILHGILAWAVAGLVSLLLLTTTVGNVVSTATAAITQGVALAGQSLVDVSPEVAEALDLQDISLETILDEGRSVLRQTEQADLQPQNLEEDVDTAGQVIQDTAGDIARRPSAAQRELDAAVSRLLLLGEDITDEDREAVVQVIVARTDLTEAEARETLNRWEQTFAEVRADAENAVREAGQAVADTIAAIAGMIFAAMVVGAFAAGSGGWIGSPEEAIPVTR